MSDCIFCRMAKGEIPCGKVYEDDDILAFKDIHPQAPVHLLIIPKRHIESLAQVGKADAEVLGRIMTVVPQVAAEQGCTDGFRTVINTGRVGGQEVYHLHVHVLGGPERLPGMIKH